MKVLLVGHGPGILRGLGPLIDTFTVVRCKAPLPTGCDVKHYGTRMDYVLVRPGTPHHANALSSGMERHRIWEFPFEGNGFPNWRKYWKKHCPKDAKYSHGLAAAFMAMDRLKPDCLWVIGYDRLLGRYETGKSWETKQDAWKYTYSAHDWRAEHDAMMGLGVPIIELVRDCPKITQTPSAPTLANTI